MIWQDQPCNPYNYRMSIPKDEFENYGDNYDNLITKMYKNENYIFDDIFFKDNYTQLTKSSSQYYQCSLCEDECSCNLIHLQMTFNGAPYFISLQYGFLPKSHLQKIICKYDTTIKDIKTLISRGFTLVPGYFMKNDILLGDDITVQHLGKSGNVIRLTYTPIYNDNKSIKKLLMD